MRPIKCTAVVGRAKRLCASLHPVFLACSVMVFSSLPGRTTGLAIVPTFDDASFTAAGYNPIDVHNGFELAEAPLENSFSDPVHANIIAITVVVSPLQNAEVPTRSWSLVSAFNRCSRA